MKQTSTPPPLTPEEQKALVRTIAIVGVIDAVLILAGVGLYVLTENVAYPIIGAVAGMAVMVVMVIVPQVRRQLEAQNNAGKGANLVE